MTSVKFIFLLLIITFFVFSFTEVHSQQSPITNQHIEQINNLLQRNNVPRGYAVLDRFGRIELKGEYEDEDEVDRAFSIAQTVVGIKWVSPVTPENIKV